MSKPVQRPKKAASKKATASAGKAAGGKAGRSRAGRSGAELSLGREQQVRLYEKAMRAFHAGEFAAAKAAFEEAGSGPNLEMAHSARVHRRVCERRLAAGEPNLPTPEDHYDYAIALINRRQYELAGQHLREAVETKPDADHIHYALALNYGLQEKFEQAAAHLARAIEIDAKNRTIARNDADFESFAGSPPVRAVLYPERKPPE